MSLYISRIMTRWCITYFVIDIPKFPSLFDKGPGPPTFEQRPILDSKSWGYVAKESMHLVILHTKLHPGAKTNSAAIFGHDKFA